MWCYRWMLAAAGATGTRAMASLAAVAQMTVTADVAANLAQAAGLVERAKAAGAAMVFLPEAADFIGETREQTAALAEPLGGPTVAAFRELAKRHEVWLSLGGLHIREEQEDRVSNMHLVVDSQGEVAATYCKAHLFDATVPGKFDLQESRYVAAGAALTPPLASPLGRLGLGVCYDLRFAEHSQALAAAGAELLTFPSAFTVTTGEAHWEVLLRARAIESQAYVVAAAQTGQHNAKRSSYGHSLIVDPWGEVVARAGEGVGIALAPIDLERLATVRTNMPVQRQRRPDLYGRVSRYTWHLQTCRRPRRPAPCCASSSPPCSCSPARWRSRARPPPPSPPTTSCSCSGRRRFGAPPWSPAAPSPSPS